MNEADRGDPVDRSLALARAALAAPSGVKTRLRAGIAATVPLPQSTARGSREGRTSGSTVKGLVLAGAAFLAGYWLGVQRAPTSPQRGGAAVVPYDTLLVVPTTPPEQPPPAASAAAEVSEPVNGSGRAQPEATPPRAEARAQQAGRALVGAKPRAALPAQEDGFSGELSLLERAERAIRAGEGALALAFVAELDERYPRAAFDEERAATRVLAECQVHAPLARARAEAFVGNTGASVYADRVRTVCGLQRSTPGTNAEEDAARRDR